VVKALNDRYQLVLVDEFQDTDPVQWQIFEAAFTQHLVTVGDPKQAIYRFRGADVHAYLRATAGAPKVHLVKNYRSDADLVKATNVLVDGVELGDERIVGSEVLPADHAVERAIAAPPLQIRCLQFHESLLTAKARAAWRHQSSGAQPDLSMPLARAAIIDDLVNHVVELLDLESIAEGDLHHKVNPGHIAVLVPSGSVANQVMLALSRAGVPSVRTRTGSVFDTAASLEWRLLLSALERPSHAPTVRAAGLGAFMRASALELDPAAPDAARRVAALQQRCAQWADELAAQPFLAWYDHVRSQSDLAVTLLSRPSGERSLTDLDHVAELLSAELGVGRGTSASTVLRVLDRLEGRKDRAEGDDPQMRRIDSDAQAVQITTVHGSKGLEYPIVLVPIPFHVASNKGARVYNDGNGDRIVDIAKAREWAGGTPETSVKGRKYFDDVGARGDRLRLLYVGLTRGEHRTVLWWAPVEDAKKSAINTVLFDRDGDGLPLNTRPDPRIGPKGGVNPDLAAVANPADGDVLGRLAPLVHRSEGCIDTRMIAPEGIRSVWSPITDSNALPQLAVADPAGRVVRDAAWKRWSFSSITADRPDDWMHQAPVAGGSDEPDDDSDGQPGAQPSAGPAHSPAPATLAMPAMPLREVKGGTSFGTMVHSVLERIDPTSASLEADVHAAVLHELRSDRLELDVGDVVAGLCAAIRTPMGAVVGGLRLADIPVADRLAELDFDLPLCSAAQRRVTPRHIGEALVSTLRPDDPQLPYARALAEGRFQFDLAGYLQGSIDAVFRVPGPDGQPRFVVVDYKTNRLHDWKQSDPLAAYHPHLLPDAMAHSDYPLQAMLYSVAVHRYLRWRLPGYRPEVHLGGVAYLFVRGMVGPATPQHEGRPYGVFQWQPPASAVLALDSLFSQGVPLGGGR
jgi:exodeoxyribonuclease V beta subunit